MDSKQLLERYAEMLNVSRRMEECARAEQWDSLSELEQIRVSITDELMEHENETLWTGGDREIKGELIRSILEMDGEIKRRALGWKDELQDMLGSIDNEKKLSKAYRAP